MKISQIINEGATDILYHFSPIYGALQILKDGHFKLSTSYGDYTETLTKRDFPYFLSTTRTIAGKYHRNKVKRYSSRGGVMFVLDGRRIGNDYHTKAVDYYGDNTSGKALRGTGQAEAEDRIFSKKNTMPLTYVNEIHVFNERTTRNENPNIRQIFMLAKMRGIQTYFYDDLEAWLLLDIRRTVKLTDKVVKARMRGSQPIDLDKDPIGYQDDKKFISAYTELLYKKSIDKLSHIADMVLHEILYYDLDTHGLRTLSRRIRDNSRPDYLLNAEVVKLITYMRKHGYRTLKDLLIALKIKWENIKNASV